MSNECGHSSANIKADDDGILKCTGCGSYLFNIFGSYRSEIDTHKREITRLRAELEEAHREALSLAKALWNRHYREDAPQWEPLEDVAGIITQINNMTAGLGQQIDELKAQQPLPAAPESE